MPGSGSAFAQGECPLSTLTEITTRLVFRELFTILFTTCSGIYPAAGDSRCKSDEFPRRDKSPGDIQEPGHDGQER